MSKPEHDDRIHPNRYERSSDERSIYKRYEDAVDDHKELREKYDDLIDQVTTKHPGETRHETAKRYIRECEDRFSISWYY